MARPKTTKISFTFTDDFDYFRNILNNSSAENNMTINRIAEESLCLGLVLLYSPNESDKIREYFKRHHGLLLDSGYIDELLKTAKKISVKKGTYSMEKYKQGYNYFFCAKDEFVHKGEKINALSIDVVFNIYDKYGNEIVNNYENDHAIFTLEGREIYACDLFDCIVSDRENLYEFVPRLDLLKNIGACSFEIVGYTKDKLEALENSELQKMISNAAFLNPIGISEEEFKDIFRSHFELFDIEANKPTQIGGFFSQKVAVENELDGNIK